MWERFSRFIQGYNTKTPELPPPLTRERMMTKRWWAIFRRFPERPHLVGAELGVCHGNMSKYLLGYKPSIHMTFVDIHRRESFLATVKPFREETYDFYEMPTTEAATLVPDNHFDFVFIDADHAYASVRQDIIDWLPKVKPGGWLCGHDYNKLFTADDRDTKYAVKKAVTELLPDHEEDVNDTWFHRKPG
jgi:hypothetical protein